MSATPYTRSLAFQSKGSLLHPQPSPNRILPATLASPEWRYHQQAIKKIAPRVLKTKDKKFIFEESNLKDVENPNNKYFLVVNLLKK